MKQRPPNIQAEGITAAKISKLDIASEVEGYYPEHLPLKFKPQLIKKARRTAIRRDRDIPNLVFTPDTRYIFRDTSFPWCTTGKVVTEDGSCTGTMVGRRLMLTAGLASNGRPTERGGLSSRLLITTEIRRLGWRGARASSTGRSRTVRMD
jgi:hypothetical protein